VHGLNLRAFEAAAAGGLGTYPLVPDLADVFVPGEEIVAYRDLPDLKVRIDALLASPARAAAIAAAGRARVLREHTFVHRAARLLSDWLS
jgi:spore maturation protein CgeB